MPQFEDYFSEENIIGCLCQIRISHAQAVHEAHFYRKIFRLGPEKSANKITELLPPRRSWHRFRPQKSKRGNKVDATRISIERCIQWHRHHSSSRKPQWLIQLDSFVAVLQTRVLNGKFAFTPPTIIPQLKKGSDYRAIASFRKIEDKVVDILNAKYLRESLDNKFEESAIAFRAKRREPINRESAIDQIFHLLDKSESTLFVTECDIKGFFDCVHHSAAKTALTRVTNFSRKTGQKIAIDQRAVEIFNAYLNCYSFSQTVLSKESQLKTKTSDPDANYKWQLSGKKQIGLLTA